MKAALIATLMVTALTVPAAVGAVPSDGMPGASWYGLCTAYENNENGRENGNAGNAGPFAWLQEQADENDQTVSEWCAENTEHPSNNGNGNGNANGRP